MTRRASAAAAALRPAMPGTRAVLLVVTGGILGTSARYLVDVAVPHVAGLPWPTLLVNLTGAFVLGMLLEALVGTGGGHRQWAWRLALGTGFVGSFTTYSSLAVELTLLLQSGRVVEGVGYGLVSLVVGAAVTAAGVVLGTALRRRNRRSGRRSGRAPKGSGASGVGGGSRDA